MNTKIGYTEELLPNGQVAKSSGRWGFRFLLWFGAIYAVMAFILYWMQFFALMDLLTKTIDVVLADGKTVKQAVMSPSEFRLTIASNALTFGFVVTVFTIAFGGKGYYKKVETNKLDKDTPDLSEPTQGQP